MTLASQLQHDTFLPLAITAEAPAMSKFRLLCLLNSHRPIREGIGWNGMTYVGKCKHCGSEIRRRDRGGWRKRLPPEISASSSPEV